MPEAPTSFTELLQRKILPNVQRIAFVIVVAGLVLLILHYPGAHELLLIGFTALAMTFFLMAFNPLHIPEGSRPDGLTQIVYKIIYIGCSVETIGILFQFLKFNGAEQMLQVGSVGIGGALVVSGLLIVKTSDNWRLLKDAILRGATLFLLGIYMMRQASIG